MGENELHGAHRDRSFLAIDELPPDDALALIESYQPDGRLRSEAVNTSKLNFRWQSDAVTALFGKTPMHEENHHELICETFWKS
jgi:hypothetical protein